MYQEHNFNILFSAIKDYAIQCRYVAFKLESEKIILAELMQLPNMLYLYTENNQYRVEFHYIDIPATEIYKMN
jgi:hypothetical protein